MNNNPILNLLNNQSSGSLSRISQIKNIMNLLKKSNNPQAMLQQMLQNSPQGQDIARRLQESNGDAKTAFYNLAKEKGVNPN